MSDRGKVTILFQGPDFSHADPNNVSIDMDKARPSIYQLDVTVESMDLDYGTITVDVDLDDGDNLILAVPAAMCNEEGVPLGEIAWRIEPDRKLLEKVPGLAEFIGCVFGRVITVNGGDRPIMAKHNN